MSGLIHRWVSEQADRRGDRPAVSMGGESVSYGALEASSNQVARLLADLGCAPGDRVTLLMPKSPATIVGMLGILKAGGAYVPLDTSGAAARVADMVRRCGSRIMLVDPAAASLLASVMAEVGDPDLRVVWMSEDRPDGAAGPTLADAAGLSPEAVAVRRDDADLCYILFTSGSTGAPKGVMIRHANVAHFIGWATRHFGMGPDDRVSGHSPLHFDLSVFDVFGAFAAGAELHLVPQELNLLPNKLAAFIRDRELTQWFSVPSVLSYMKRFDVGRQGDFPALRRLLWCGEVFPTPALRYWMERLPHVTFTNLYGPTEATIASSVYTVPACPSSDADEIPIGVPCEGEDLLILDEAMRPLPAGETGELFIEGPGLSPGYWEDPERTAEAFVDWTDGKGVARRIYRTGDLARLGADAQVYFVGRRDSQIKSRGYRIELGEIEAAVNALDEVSDGVVLALQSDGFEGAAICCAYVLHPDHDIDPAGLRRLLKPRLPKYMMPARWMRYEDFPRNANGKIDRRGLRERFEEDTEQSARSEPMGERHVG